MNEQYILGKAMLLFKRPYIAVEIYHKTLCHPSCRHDKTLHRSHTFGELARKPLCHDVFFHLLLLLIRHLRRVYRRKCGKLANDHDDNNDACYYRCN